MHHRTLASAVTIRAATGDDRAVLERLIAEGASGTSYQDVPQYFLRLALAGRADESRGIVAVRNGAVVGCALFGYVAGAVGTARVHFVAVTASERRLGTGRSLCMHIVNEASTHGARSVIVEMPDEHAFRAGQSLLEHCGFVHVARVADYYRDGVSLVVLHHAIAPRD